MTHIIKNVFDFNKAVSTGPYAWPGGYEHYFLCDDGEAMTWDAVLENQRLVRDAVINQDHSGWHVIAMCVNWEDQDLRCAHTGALIKPQYRSNDET